jgi:hypothetical protein
MKYAITPPPEPGYYWMQDADGDAVVEVFADPGSPNPDELFFHQCGDGNIKAVSEVPGVYWAGPLDVPSPADVRVGAADAVP